MKNLGLITFLVLFSLSSFAAKKTVLKHSKKSTIALLKEAEKKKNEQKTTELKPSLEKLVESYASYYRVDARASGFKAKLTTRDMKLPKPKKPKKLAKQKLPQVPIQKFQFRLNVVQEDIRQVKFGVISLGEKIRDDVAQRYCNEQNLKMDQVLIGLISNEETDNRREISFWVSGSCIKYRYRSAKL